MLEFVFSLTIQNADTLTVGEYNAARWALPTDSKISYKAKRKNKLQNDSFMQEAIHAEIEKLNEQWNTDKLKISEGIFLHGPFRNWTGPEKVNRKIYSKGQERREYPNAHRGRLPFLIGLENCRFTRKGQLQILTWIY